MKLNKLLTKIQELLDERNWTLYRLSKEANIPYSSLNSLFLKNNQPTVSTLEKVCDGFHITLSEFFSEDTPYRDETPLITEDEKVILNTFRNLSKKDKQKYLEIMKILNN
ncbi:MAG: helix-turn-helix transcriptional regulator [bacterium]|nr:helix-turn-helix transcriptional regulator [bacterium]